MPVLFRFDENDSVLQGYLSSVRLTAVTTWQTSHEFSFEFHSGHTTGHPIYVRPATNRDSSNVPKMDTINHSASDYDSTAKFANGEKLSVLSNPAKANLLAIVEQNWDALKELATNYWTNSPVTADKNPEDLEHEAWVKHETADTGQHFEEISREQLNAIYGRSATKRGKR